jgi:hypothetical protein
MKIQAFDFSVDLLRALLWQYNDAARLQSLLEQKQAWYDLNQSDFWDAWVRDVFDLRTASDFGLSVWAIILNVPLVVVSDVNPTDQQVWGFATDDENFTRGNFYPTQTAGLTTEQKRLVLRLRYFDLVTRGAVPEINAFMAYLFADYGPVYVNDGLSMKARYVFGFPLPSKLATVLRDFDLLPRPAGVAVDYVVVGEADGWGFGAYHENFTNGNFYHE